MADTKDRVIIILQHLLIRRIGRHHIALPMEDMVHHHTRMVTPDRQVRSSQTYGLMTPRNFGTTRLDMIPKMRRTIGSWNGMTRTSSE